MVETPAAKKETMYVRATLGPFDVRVPPVRKHMVKGHLVPNLKSRFMPARRRRIGIEIMAAHGDDNDESNNSDTLDDGTTKSWDPRVDKLGDHDDVVLKILKLAKGTEEDQSSEDDDDDMSVVSTLEAEDEDEHGMFWREYRHYRFDNVELLKESHKHVELQLGAGNETVVRDIKFESEADAKEFHGYAAQLRSLMAERSSRLVAQYKKKLATPEKTSSFRGLISSEKMPQSPRDASETIEEGEDEDIKLLVEIVSATDVPIADLTSTDAYCIVRMKGKEIHRTSVIHNNLSPIWTLETGALFLLEMTPEEFFSSSAGMTIVLKDFDVVGSNDMLGSVTIPLEELLAGMGERKGYPIIPEKKPIAPRKGQKPKTPMLFMRYKKATQEDVDFMSAYNDKSKKFGLYADECFLPIRKQDKKFMKRQTKKGLKKETLHRVRPGPDPDREDQVTKWLTKEDIHVQALKPSTHWIEAGSGDIGKIYFELIGCDNLPNMDSMTLNMSDKTDAFACVVFEDCVVNTDVIGDTLSPRWMPWCHRAFAFNVSHPSSDILIGIFDHDPELSPAQLASRAATPDVHDPIGRLVINVSNFLPDTEYLLKYPLYYGELAEHREETRGTVTVRLRVEFPDMRKMMLQGKVPPPSTVVSVARSIDFHVAHYTTDGVVDDSQFSLDTLTRYIAELETYQAIVPKIMDAAMVVWLWRGHYLCEIAGKKYNLPLHSITAFTWGILVTWNYNFLPSFWVFCIGWLLLACNEHVQQHPSRWYQCPSYYNLLRRLVLQSSSSELVVANSNIADINLYNKKVEERKKRLEEDQKKEMEHDAMIQSQLGAEMEKAEEAEQMEGKGGGLLSKIVPASPLKPHLYPIQKQLAQVVEGMRIAKSIVLWYESYYAFWMVTACFGTSMIAALIPWGFLLRWTLRITVFVALGPWMMIVDRKFFKTDPNMTKEEQDEVLRLRLKAKYEESLQSATDFFIRKERAVKLKSMAKYMFGSHLLKVPRFCNDLYMDIPLPSSSCAPVDMKKLKPIQIDECKFGQKLSGDMIPVREVQAASAAKKTEKRNPKLFGRARMGLEKVPLLGEPMKGYNSTK